MPSHSTRRASTARVPLIVFLPGSWRSAGERAAPLWGALGRRFELILIEEPLFFPGRPSLFPTYPVPGVEVLTPRTPVVAQRLEKSHLPWLGRLLADLLDTREMTAPLAWLFDSQALPLLEHLEPRALIHECVGTPALPPTTGAPSGDDLALLAMADVVLTDESALVDAWRTHRPDLQRLSPGVQDGAPFGNVSREAAADEVERLLAPFLAEARTGSLSRSTPAVEPTGAGSPTLCLAH